MVNVWKPPKILGISNSFKLFSRYLDLADPKLSIFTLPDLPITLDTT